MVAIADMMRKKTDGRDPNLFEHFSSVTQSLGVYTAHDYADILEFLIGRWKLAALERGLSGEGRDAQEYVCGLPPRIRKLQERAEERAKKLGPRPAKFSWIFDREVVIV
ncbi:hypothetical protein DM860_005594 [Cuscuta australis]|uniref:Acyl-[acyl-carrier-protein] desaturase n=1 Tax=Cuscuta australis TaxID=267555 RepID=A0A328DSB6_9ASTE|nr:hypothetical protein DM860_005594 [Cuscuta australis]